MDGVSPRVKAGGVALEADEHCGIASMRKRYLALRRESDSGEVNSARGNADCDRGCPLDVANFDYGVAEKVTFDYGAGDDWAGAEGDGKTRYAIIFIVRNR